MHRVGQRSHLFCYVVGPQTRLMTIILSNLNRLKNFTRTFLGKFVVKWILKIRTINDKLQGSVATYLRCGGVVSNQIKKGLLLSL